MDQHERLRRCTAHRLRHTAQQAQHAVEVVRGAFARLARKSGEQTDNIRACLGKGCRLRRVRRPSRGKDVPLPRAADERELAGGAHPGAVQQRAQLCAVGAAKRLVADAGKAHADEFVDKRRNVNPRVVDTEPGDAGGMVHEGQNFPSERAHLLVHIAVGQPREQTGEPLHAPRGGGVNADIVRAARLRAARGKPAARAEGEQGSAALHAAAEPRENFLPRDKARHGQRTSFARNTGSRLRTSAA